MRFERLVAEWLLLTIALALVAGGKPWRFPAGGRHWLAHHLRARSSEHGGYVRVPLPGRDFVAGGAVAVD
jgi:hypothetical protein